MWALLILSGVVLGTLLLNVTMEFWGTTLTEQVEQYHRLLQGQIGAFCRAVFENMLLPVGDHADFDGLYPADR